mgnify:CR=1 FL=1
MKRWLLATSLFTACLSTAPAEGSAPDIPAAVARKVPVSYTHLTLPTNA